MEIQPSKTVKKKKQKSKAKVKKVFTKADAFLLFEAEGIEKNTTPLLLTYRQKELIRDLLIKELQTMNDDNYTFEEDKLLKQSILSKYYENREQVIEAIYKKLHE